MSSIRVFETRGSAGGNLSEAAVLPVHTQAVEYQPLAIWIEENQLADIPRAVDWPCHDSRVVLARPLR
jgi:hypothetical protein